MVPTYWQKQTPTEPLFGDLLWSRPENRQLAGKLLIVGGNLYGFSGPAGAYQTATQAGVGVARVLLPDALHKTVGRAFEAGEFAPSTPSGSFSQKALAELLNLGAWADSVLLAGDLGRNSETAIVLEKFADKYAGQLTVTKDAADYFVAAPQKILMRPETLFVVSFAQLQKLAQNAKFPHAFTFDMDLLHLIETLHQFGETFAANIIVKHLNNIFAAANGQVSSTRLPEEKEIWRVPTAASAAVWWLQNPSKPYEALTTAVSETSKQL